MKPKFLNTSVWLQFLRWHDHCIDHEKECVSSLCQEQKTVNTESSQGFVADGIVYCLGLISCRPKRTLLVTFFGTFAASTVMDRSCWLFRWSFCQGNTREIKNETQQNINEGEIKTNAPHMTTTSQSRPAQRMRRHTKPEPTEAATLLEPQGFTVYRDLASAALIGTVRIRTVVLESRKLPLLRV